MLGAHGSCCGEATKQRLDPPARYSAARNTQHGTQQCAVLSSAGRHGQWLLWALCATCVVQASCVRPLCLSACYGPLELTKEDSPL